MNYVKHFAVALLFLAAPAVVAAGGAIVPTTPTPPAAPAVVAAPAVTPAAPAAVLAPAAPSWTAGLWTNYKENVVTRNPWRSAGAGLAVGAIAYYIADQNCEWVHNSVTVPAKKNLDKFAKNLQEDRQTQVLTGLGVLAASGLGYYAWTKNFWRAAVAVPAVVVAPVAPAVVVAPVAPVVAPVAPVVAPVVATVTP